MPIWIMMHLIQKRHPEPLRYSQLISFVTPHRRTLVVIVLLLLAGTLLTLLTPLIAGKLTQTLLEGPAISGYPRAPSCWPGWC